MTERDPNTEDMFGDEIHAEHEDIIAHISELEPNDLTQTWPKRLVELTELISHHLTQRQQLESTHANKEAVKLVAIIAHYFGGMAFYLPHGKGLEKFLRDIEIYKSFKGNNQAELARKYKLSHQQIYTVIAKQHRLRLRKVQPQLDLQ
ncbi:MAG: Mor transcription activator family protein [Thiomicrospira sp.]